MKISILYDAWEGTEEVPGGESRRGEKRLKLDRDEIADVLTKAGHDVSFHVLDGKNPSLLALAKIDADLIFNLVESYGGDDRKEVNVAAFLDLLGKRYTGSGSDGLMLALNKGIAKKIMRFHELYTPYFALSYRGRLEHAHDIRFPLIVKPAGEDGSKGIDVHSVVYSIKELMERIAYIHDEFDTPVLIEEYIEGREIYVGVIGNEKAEALPLVELDLSKLPDDIPKIAGYEVKFERDSVAYRKTKSRVVEDLDEQRTAAIQEAALTAYRALQLRDYGRIDLRIAADGKIYVIEVNPNPWLSSSAEFVMAARASGRTYPGVIQEIVELARERS